MLKIIKKIIKIFIPYGLIILIRKLKQKENEKNEENSSCVWTGNYSSWQKAEESAGSYDSDVIFEKVRNALLKVKNGTAIYERDGVIFDKIEYSWPLLVAILLASSERSSRINVLDFGGSLGSTFFQNRKFLDELIECKWFISEQKKFVEIGKDYFENDKLKFIENIDDIPEKIDLVIFSSVLQYLKDPFIIVEKIISLGSEYIVVDLTGFVDYHKDIITIQNVSPNIYKASYPCRLFNEEQFLSKFEEFGKYRLVESFDCVLGQDMFVDEKRFKYRGMIFRKQIK